MKHTVFFFLVFTLHFDRLETKKFLLQSPTHISQQHISELPQIWIASFSKKDACITFLHYEGRSAIATSKTECLIQLVKLFTKNSNTLSALKKNLQTLYTYLNMGGSYKVHQSRNFSADTHHPQILSIDQAAEFIKIKKVLFYTGAGISKAADVDDMHGLIKLLHLEEFKKNGIPYLKTCKQEIIDNFNSFCNRAFNAAPTQAHEALSNIAFKYNITIMTENFDFLHQRSGLMPYCISANSLRKNVTYKELKEIDIVICLGLSHDDRGFLGWYKGHNPQGTIIAFDLGIPEYLSDEDYVVLGDLQTTVPQLQKFLL